MKEKFQELNQHDVEHLSQLTGNEGDWCEGSEPELILSVD